MERGGEARNDLNSLQIHLPRKDFHCKYMIVPRHKLMDDHQPAVNL